MRSSSIWTRTVRSFAEATAAVAGDQVGNGDSLIHKLDPRAKVVAFALLASASASLASIPALCVLLLAGVAVALAVRIPVEFLTRKAWGPAMVLAAMLALPLIFVAPRGGEPAAPSFVPTEEGVRFAGAMVLRVLAASTFCCLLLVSTRWSVLLKALRLLGAPAALVSVVSLAFRYTVYFFRTAQEMFEAAESRRVGRMKGADYRRQLGAQLGVLTGKTVAMSDAVYLAMLSRGYRGEVRVIDKFTMEVRDWLTMGLALLVSVALLILGK